MIRQLWVERYRSREIVVTTHSVRRAELVSDVSGHPPIVLERRGGATVVGNNP